MYLHGDFPTSPTLSDMQDRGTQKGPITPYYPLYPYEDSVFMITEQ